MRTLLLIALLLVTPVLSAASPDAEALYRDAQTAARAGDVPKALSLATKAIEAAPKETRARLLRARLYESRREHAKAVSDYSEVLKLDPQSNLAWQRRGEARFKLGQVRDALSDFDRYLELVPEQKPYHWQRGIALYYAGRFAEGKQQFELHQTVNSNDVENAVWHFLCTARAEGLEAARKKLIPIEGDTRVPMAEVHRLFAGKATPEDVLAAARAAPASTPAGEPLFYANLYLGLYYEATGDRKQARAYIRKAADRADENGYMGDVARVHAELLGVKAEKK